MIDIGARAYGLTTYKVSCDRCSTGFKVFESKDWGGLTDEMKDNNWTITTESGQEEHICPNCSGVK